ncbi:fumarylacetoacetate hydrolase family protein [Embleya sp. NBC_00888]|uniref:fumarylacetoacetate hydrolase family protein n=1 Tax=Embleya sp. NBC_00888 TaxID=2975960 RepID=UPI00386897DB|nr:fumarylacetoacetate hydrolase family protein [Embleya sp. NBC_00888]
MRFVTIEHESVERVGILDGETIRVLEAGVSLLGLLGGDGSRLGDAGERALRSPDLVVPIADAHLRAPVPRPPSVRDYMTFEQHFEGVARTAGPKAAVPPFWYTAPSFYFANPNSIHGPYDDVAVPPGCTAFDLELEVAVVLGSGGRDLTPAEAERRIAGFMLMNDWSARDLQAAEFALPLGPGKGKDSAISLGPWFVTPDELAPMRRGDSYDIALTARINDEVIGADTVSSMSFSFGQMIAYASRGTDVRAGDVFASGTCGGGCLAELWGRHGPDIRRPLSPGDVVSIEAQGLGRQTSRVVVGAPGIDFEAFAAGRR